MLILGAVILAVAAVAGLAINRYDAFLRLQPRVCVEGMPDRQFIVTAIAAPLWLLFVLTTIGEGWAQLENRRAGRATRWSYFGLFLALASALGLLVLSGLAC